MVAERYRAAESMNNGIKENNTNQVSAESIKDSNDQKKNSSSNRGAENNKK